jgi:predicted TIM-barrel fold metal-dependent hydrolase
VTRADADSVARRVAECAGEDLVRIREAEAARGEPTLAGPAPLVDVHAHFWHPASPRADWRAVNAARLRAGERMGIGWHVASVLGSWGATSPTYFASPADVTLGNTVMLALQHALPDRVRAYVHVNPNFTAHALDEIRRARGAGAVGIKLSASRRADDRALLDPICDLAVSLGLPILHHVWQWRRRDWPMQEASDAVELGRLAAAHPRVRFVLAHIGGGGDWQHTNHAVRHLANVYPDLSGSGVDRGMLDAALAALGAERLLWACDLTMCTGLAKLRALEVIGLDERAMAAVRWANAARVFPADAFPGLDGARPPGGA